MTAKQQDWYAKIKEFAYVSGLVFTILSMWNDLSNKVTLNKQKTESDIKAVITQHQNDIDLINYKLSQLNKP